jgi:hypothetical protein
MVKGYMKTEKNFVLSVEQISQMREEPAKLIANTDIRVFKD